MLVTAESCTGGWAAQVVTSVAGSSAWFERGFVTYSNAAKRELLGVQASTLGAHGAVSEETAREMARGALSRGKGTVALAVTGVAGPAAAARTSRSAWSASPGRASAPCAAKRSNFPATAKACAGNRLSARSKGSCSTSTEDNAT